MVHCKHMAAGVARLTNVFLIWARLPLAIQGEEDKVAYSLISPGKRCTNTHKTLSFLAESAQACAEMACSDPECGDAFESRSHSGEKHCACMAMGQECIEVDDPRSNRYQITDTSACMVQASGDCFATLHENGDFSGWTASFPEGVYSGEEFLAAGAVDNEASSLFVNGANCFATVYDNEDFTGWSATFPEGSYSLEELENMDAKGDQISAIVVRFGNGTEGAKPHSAGAQPAAATVHGTELGGPVPPPSQPLAPDLPPTAVTDGALPPAPPPAPRIPKAEAGQAPQTSADGALRDTLGRVVASPNAGPRPSPPPPPPPPPPRINRPRTAPQPTASQRPWESQACDPVSGKSCSEDEMRYAQHVVKEHPTSGNLEHEAYRIRLKRLDLPPPKREWIDKRLNILFKLAADRKKAEL